MRSFKTIRDAEIAFAQLEERLRLLELGRGGNTVGQTSSKEVIVINRDSGADNSKLKALLDQDVVVDNNIVTHNLRHNFNRRINSKDNLTITSDAGITWGLNAIISTLTGPGNLQLTRTAPPVASIVVLEFEATGTNATLKCDHDILPMATNSYTLGSTSLKWKNIYTTTLGITDVSTQGAIPYVDASGNLDEDPTRLSWNATDKRLRAADVVSFPYTPNSGCRLLLASSSGATRVNSYSFGVPNSHDFLRANGTISSPTALLSGEIIGQITGFGYDGTTFTTSSRAAIQLSTAENWSTTANGTKIIFYTTPNGSATITAAAAIENTGDITLVKKITTYNNIATEGYGTPVIVDDVALTNQSAAIGTTNFTNANVAGTYLIVYRLMVTTADATAGTITLTISWTDDLGATTVVQGPVTLTATGRYAGFALPQLSSGNITYSVSVAGAVNNARFALYMSCIRLS